MRAFIYCRVSDPRQEQNLSLETQESACRAYCVREGYDVGQVFVDAGESAKTADRPAFTDLLAACRGQKGRVHAVIVYSLTRFSRNTADHHAIAALLRGHGIALRSVTEPIDESPSGRLMEAILAGVAQFDNDVRSTRAIAGMKTALQKGRWLWKPPIGYRTGRRGGPSLEIDPAVAPLIRRAFEWLADGDFSGRVLRDQLAQIGLRGRGGKPLVKSRICALLKNPVYIGRVETSQWGVSVVGDFPAIIDEDVFYRAQVRLAPQRAAQRQAHRHTNHPDFPLRRFVRCSTCGLTVTGGWSRGRSQRYAYYHCDAKCTLVPKAELERAFIELLEQLAPRRGYLAALRAVALDVWQDERRSRQEIRRASQNRVTSIEGKLTRLDQAFIYDEAIDNVTYRRERDTLREQLALAHIDVHQAEADEIDISALFDFAEHALEHASALWTNAADVDERIRVQATMFPDGLTWQPAPRARGRALEPRVRGHFLEPRNCLAFFELPSSAEEMTEWRTKRVEPRTQTADRIRRFLVHIDGLRRAA